MLNKIKSKVSFDFGFFGIIPFLIDFSSFPLKNSRRLSLKNSILYGFIYVLAYGSHLGRG